MSDNHASDEFTDIQQYWDSLELAAEFRSVKQKRDMQGVFLAGVTAVRDLMHKIAGRPHAEGVAVVNKMERDILRWMKEMRTWGDAPGADPGPNPAVDLTTDRTEYFRREVLPIMRNVIDKAQAQGIGLIAAFELQRHPDATVKLASLLVPSSDGTINDVMAKVMREFSNQAPECEPVATLPSPSQLLH